MSSIVNKSALRGQQKSQSPSPRTGEDKSGYNVLMPKHQGGIENSGNFLAVEDPNHHCSTMASKTSTSSCGVAVKGPRMQVKLTQVPQPGGDGEEEQTLSFYPSMMLKDGQPEPTPRISQILKTSPRPQPQSPLPNSFKQDSFAPIDISCISPTPEQNAHGTSFANDFPELKLGTFTIHDNKKKSTGSSKKPTNCQKPGINIIQMKK